MRGASTPVTANDRSGGDREERRPTPKASDQPNTPLEEPVTSRATLARRLRAVERALSGDADVAFEAEAGRSVDPAELEAVSDRLDTMADRLDAAEDRLDALSRAVRAIGGCLVARDRARRRDDGTESVRRAVEALTESEDPSPDDRAGGGHEVVDRGGTADSSEPRWGGRTGELPALAETAGADGNGDAAEESPTEWLDRVAAGGVTPPRVE